jgi:hypothetical protein
VTTVLGAALFFVSGPLIAFAVRLLLPDSAFFFLWICADVGGMVSVIGRDWPDVTSIAASGLLALILWWRSRRKRRRRSLWALGYKAKARLEAMARNMPRIAPRPVPA